MSTSQAVNRIRQLRIERGLRLTDLALKAAIDKSTLSRAEKPTASPRIPHLKRIAAALNCTLEDLVA